MKMEHPLIFHIVVDRRKLIGGNMIDHILYFPFGSARSGSVPTDIKFTGQRLDDTGLYYYGARYYDPTIGRFTSVDPLVSDIFNPQTINPYSYCLNNPLKYIDPTGRQTGLLICILIACLLAIGAGGAIAINSANSADSASIGDIGDLFDEVEQFIDTNAAELADLMSPPSEAPLSFDTLGLQGLEDAFFTEAEGEPDAVEEATMDTEGAPSDQTNEEKGSKTEQGKLIEDFEEHPENWVRTAHRTEEPTSPKYKGGIVVEEEFTQKSTGKVIERQTIYDESGKIVHQHPRVK
jgi:RHS repeat-associated protein